MVWSTLIARTAVFEWRMHFKSTKSNASQQCLCLRVKRSLADVLLEAELSKSQFGFAKGCKQENQIGSLRTRLQVFHISIIIYISVNSTFVVLHLH